MKTYPSHYINGRWVTAQSSETFSVHDSSTEEVMATVPAGTADEARAAIQAAHAAFPAWAALPVETRASFLDKVSAGLKARIDEMAITIAREVGMPVKLAKPVQVAGPVWNWANFAKVAREFEWEETVAAPYGQSLVLREPIGVVGCITPWNFPLNQITLKVAPALAAGCTVVLKPSEIAPVNAMILAEIIHEAGLPPGVFNLVNGAGPVVGEVLATDSLVDMVSFTGSTRAGKQVAAAAAATVKRVALELGGKSANIILDDADFAAVIPKGVFAAYLNSGQTCTAHTRMLVPNSRYDEAVAIAAAAAENMPVDDPSKEGMHLGPLISQAQWDRVQGYIQKGIDEGAVVAAGGLGKPEGHETGYFVKPTVLANVTNDMTVAQEEIFGPVLSIIGYEDDDDAVRIANDSLYGLSGGVWSADQDRAIAVARRMRTGAVDVNGGSFNIAAPFGGYKQSGYGRENGPYGIDEFLQTKSLQL